MTNDAAATGAQGGAENGGQGGGENRSATFQPSDNGGSQEFQANGGQGGAADFLSTLPEEYRTDPTFRDVKDLASLAKGYANAQKLVGAKALAKPGEGATPEQIAAWRKTMGVPDTADGYKMPEVKLPEGVTYPTEELQKGMAKYAAELHRLGAPPEVAEGLMAFYMNDLGEMLNEAKEAETQASAQKAEADDAEFAQMMQETYGDKAQRSHAIAQNLLANFIPAESAAEISSLSNKQLFAVTQAIIGIADKYIAEDKLPRNIPNQSAGNSDADRIKLQQERFELMKDPWKNREAIEQKNQEIAKAYGRA